MLKNRKRIIVLLFIVIFVYIFYQILIGPGNKGAMQKIGNAVIGNNKTITIVEHTPFEWSKMFIFPPYTLIENMEEDLGIEWYYWDKPLYDDGANYFVFLKDHKVVAEWNHPIALGDFRYVYRKSGFTPEDATFDISIEGRVNNGSPWHVLKPIAQSKD